MLTNILMAGGLVAATVAVHAIGLVLLLKFMPRPHAKPAPQFWPVTGLLVGVAWYLILIHLIEIAIWGTFYYRMQCLPDAESAFYFAGVTYTTVGYGDLVLPKAWRLYGPVEGLTGILMCGLSTGLFFAVVSRAYASILEKKSKRIQVPSSSG